MNTYAVVCLKCNETAGVSVSVEGITCVCQRRSAAIEHLLLDIERHIEHGDFDRIMPSVEDYRRLLHHLSDVSEQGYNGVRGLGSEELKIRLANRPGHF